MPGSLTKMGVPALSLLLILVAASGCGSKGGSKSVSEERPKAPDDVVRGLLVAISAADAPSVCAVVGGPMRAEFTAEGDCEHGVRAWLKAEPEERRNARVAKVVDTKTQGGNATVTIQVPGRDPDQLNLKLGAFEWRVVGVEDPADASAGGPPEDPPAYEAPPGTGAP